MTNLAESSTEIGHAAQEAMGQGYTYWGQFVNMLVTLGLVLVLIFVTVYLLKRLMRSRIQNLNQSTGIKILERRSLNAKSSLYLIDVLGKGVVLAESPSGVHVVVEFADGINVEERLEEILEAPKAIRASFAQQLKKAVLKPRLYKKGSRP